MAQEMQTVLGNGNTITVVSSEFEHGDLIVILEGQKPDEVGSAEARQLAYSVRTQKGMESAGLEAQGGPYPVDEKGDLVAAGAPVEPENLRFRQAFKLNRTRM